MVLCFVIIIIIIIILIGIFFLNQISVRKTETSIDHFRSRFFPTMLFITTDYTTC